VILIHQRHRQTDGQTDRRTDGQHAISIPRYALVHRAVKIDNCGSAEQKSCSGRPRPDIQSDDDPCSHKNPRKIQEHTEHCNLA